LAIVWELINDGSQPTSAKAQSLKKWDAVLGLGLMEYIARPLMVPEGVQKLVDNREVARAERDFVTSDRLREEIKKRGFIVEDTSTGPKMSEAS
ncbi:MAG: cysteine--tRNA ligase, partial [Patescibacteria group bacterium]